MEDQNLTGYGQVKNEVRAYLSNYGFGPHKSSFLYRTTESDLLKFINFQKGSGHLSTKMTINIVQKGLFAPGCNFNTLQPGNRIGFFTKEARDKWWSCEETKVKDSIWEIKEILATDVLPFFDFCKHPQNLSELVMSDKYDLLWWIPSTFIDKGYFYLKAGHYQEAIKYWENYQPSKVHKFKTIKSLIIQMQYSGVSDKLKENSRIAREKLKE